MSSFFLQVLQLVRRGRLHLGQSGRPNARCRRARPAPAACIARAPPARPTIWSKRWLTCALPFHPPPPPQGNNSLVGTIPRGMGFMTQLTRLDLSYNKGLIGTLPNMT
jgi:hypothetical protein